MHVKYTVTDTQISTVITRKMNVFDGVTISVLPLAINCIPKKDRIVNYSIDNLISLYFIMLEMIKLK